MKDSELEAMLKASRAPERPAEYWEAFPGRVMARTHRNRAEAPEEHGSWLGPFAWGTGLALACVAIGFGIVRANPALAARLAAQEKELRTAITGEARQFAALMQSEATARVGDGGSNN